MPTPIIIDCDPGLDDAVALVLAAGSPAVQLLAVTVVAGNHALDTCVLNARRVCTVAGIDAPIAAGATGPLAGGPLRSARRVHGESGLDGHRFGPPTAPVVDEPAVGLLVRTIASHPTPVTLVPTGPLTNVAVLLRDHPEVADNLDQIVLMGGSVGSGNVTACAEFNVSADPEAAAIVLESGVPTTMVGLNVTHQALATADVIARLRATSTPAGVMCADLIDFYGSRYRALRGFDAPPVHDPVAVARVIDPTIVGCVAARVTVDTSHGDRRGATVVSETSRLRPASAPEPDTPARSTQVATTLDRARYWDLVVDAARAR